MTGDHMLAAKLAHLFPRECVPPIRVLACLHLNLMTFGESQLIVDRRVQNPVMMKNQPTKPYFSNMGASTS